MENTLLIGLSRQNALRRELDVVANNIANLNTTAFKADGAVFSEYIMPRASAERFASPDRKLSFVQDRKTWHDMTQGSRDMTGSPLDVSIDGDAFLVVETPRGERYTRNGALQLNGAGELVTSNGYRVLGEAGPIQFNANDKGIEINPDGSIRVREGANANTDGGRGKLRLARFANAQALRKDGTSTFMAPPGVVAEPAPQSRVVQGTIEKSNVRSVVEMTRMIELTRAYTDVAAVLHQQGELRRSAIERLAEVPA